MSANPLGGLRRLARHRAYTLLAIATLAAGCGGLGGVAGVALSAFRQPLPYRRGGALTVLSSPGRSDDRPATIHYAEFESLKQKLPPLVASIGYGYAPEPRMVESPGERAPANVEFVSSGVFQTLGSAAAAGRTFRTSDDGTASDEAPGAGTVILSWDYRERLGGSAPPIGGILRIGGDDYRIVGVMPAGFSFPWRVKADIWAAVSSRWARKEASGLQVVARLRPGVALGSLNSALHAALASTSPNARAWPNDPDRLRFITLRQSALGSAWSEIVGLLSGSLAVCGICWLSFAALTIALWINRADEVRTRRALGASPRQLSALWLGESAWVAALGAVAAYTVALPLSHWLQARVLVGARASAPHALGAAAATATTGLALISGLTAGWSGFAAAGAAAGERLQFTRGDLRRGFRVVLVGELLFVLPALILALDFAASAAKVRNIQIGYTVRNVAVAQVEGRRFPVDHHGGYLVTAQVLSALRHEPWVLAAASSSDLPMAGTRQVPFLVSIHPQRWGPAVEMTGISPEYFSLLGVPLMKGRVFEPADATSDRLVVVVNRTMANLYWPGADPVGRVLGVDPQGDPGFVVGVVGDSRNLSPLLSAYPELFYPISQGGQQFRTTYFMVRSELPTGVAEVRLRQIVERMSSAREPIFVASTFPLEEVLSASTSPYQRRGLIWSALAAVLLALCWLSLFGVARFWAGAQRRDLAVRIALGAPQAAIVQVFLRLFGAPVLLGTAAGCALAVAPARLAAHLTYGSPPLSASVWLAATAITFCVCVTAILGPALRSVRLEAGELLRAT